MAEFDQELEQANDTVDEVDSAESDPSTGGVAPATRQPAKKVNLDEFEEFRKFKSQSQSQLQQERNARQRYEQQLQQVQQQLAQYEQYAVANMPDDDRANYETQKERNLRIAAEQRLAEREVKDQRAAALVQIASEASEYLDFEIPISALDAAESPDQAWKLAAQYRKEQLQEQAKQSDAAQQARQQKRAANKPDLGGGTPPPASDSFEALFAAAVKSRDMVALAKLAKGHRT